MKGDASRPRRRARVIATALVGVLTLGLLPDAGVAVEKELHEARVELRETRAKIRKRMKQINELQREMNKLATEISLNEAQINVANDKMEKLRFQMAVLEARTSTLQRALDARNREAYIEGPGAPLLYLLTATSAVEATDRLSLITEMNRRDELLAARVQENAERLSRARAEYLRLQRARQLALQQLEVQRAELRHKFRLAERMFDKLKLQKEDILLVIQKYRPFAICPFQGAYAIGDNFGIWVHRTKKRGGDHVHQGNDVMSPYGTPVVAPFPGTAVAVPNKLGGKAVNVYGAYGYVYNAHFSRYGQLGPVETGDVIGYVGNTGNTDANHVHFEWHPNNGDAADPYPFLMKVC
jgi:murein DD-endopeptidase MepM/ murein hydrolase activator NlpD